MNIGLKHVRAFVAVARHLHFTKAAEEIHVSQPTLTLLVRQLEAAVGVNLLNRSTRFVELTEMGREFLPMATNLVEDLDTAVTSLKELAALRRGKVTIAALPTVASNILPEIIVDYMAKYPDITVRVIDTQTETVTESIRSGAADFGVGFQHAEEKGFNYTFAFEDEVMLVVPEAHDLAGRKSVAWGEVADQPFVMTNKDTSVRKIIDQTLADAGLDIRPVLEQSMISTILSLVAAGVGIGVMPSTYSKPALLPGLVAVRAVDPVVRRPIGILTRKNRILTPPAEIMLKMITERTAGWNNWLA